MEVPQSSSPAKLPRVLGPWMATAIVIGTVIGSGVFRKPHAVARDLTEFGMIMAAWVLVGVLSFIGSLILAETAVIYPHAGGNYVYLREGYGRWAGFLWGWVEFWIIRSGSIAALATVFAESLHDILRFAKATESDGVLSMPAQVLDFWSLRLITVGVIIALALVNARGTVLGGGLQVVVTSVKVLSIVAIVLLPFICMAVNANADVDTHRLDPIWPDDIGGFDWTKFGKAMVGILWAYHGWMNLAPVAEEVKEPNRNLPLAFLMGTLAVIVLYCTVNVSYHLVVTREDMVKLGGTSPVATLLATQLLGSIGTLLLSAAIMTSVFGSLNGNLLVGPRLLYAMGQDGLAPRTLSQLHANWGTPVPALLALTAWSVLLVAGMGVFVFGGQLDKSIFEGLTDYCMFGAVAFETMAVATIFVWRRQYPVDKVQLPYRSWGYPWLPIFYVAVMAAVFVNMFVTDLKQSLASVGVVALGAIVYFLVFGNQARGEGSPAAPPPEPDAIRAGEPPVRSS